MNQHRQPAGQPIGGQFAVTTKAESGVGLGSPDPATIPLTDAERSELSDSLFETALWSSVGEDGEPLDDEYDVSDIDPSTVEELEDELYGFVEENRDLIDQAMTAQPGYGLSNVAHDFWLTRNRHGAGFWDRGLGEAGTELTELAHAYGSVDLYVGDDGAIHHQ